MSVRTIIVGVLAAFCGICATIGVMSLNQGPKQPVRTESRDIVIAKSKIDMGQEVARNFLTTMEWNSKQLPVGAFENFDDVVGKFCVSPIAAGEVVTKMRVADESTSLTPSNGMRAYAISARSPSTTVGHNLVPGNRVDIIWETNGKLKDLRDPTAIRLMQNVKILAVGKVQANLDNAQKSITFELKPHMDENLAFAQSFGSLSLSLRHPSDNEGIEPVELVRFKDLLADIEARKNQPAELGPWERMVNDLRDRLAFLESELNAEPEKPTDRETLSRIGPGMRAKAILTPNEASGVAGLIQPGDRVDLQLTMGSKRQLALKRGMSPVPSETLIENIEVLAVDSNIYSVDSDGTKKMYRSVTLIVEEPMTREIERAEHLGTLTLTLRGNMDSQDSAPRTAMLVDQFLAEHFANGRGLDMGSAYPVTLIRTLRGPAVQEMPFNLRSYDGDASY